MKIYAYAWDKSNCDGLVKPEDVINYIYNLSVADRFVDGFDIRLDQFSKKNNYLRLDFVKLRDSKLPGKAKKDLLTQSLGLQNDEWVSEETSAIYDLVGDAFYVQYNLYGPRKKSIEEYLSHFGLLYLRAKNIQSNFEKFEFTPCVGKDVNFLYKKMRIFKKLQMKVSVPPVSSHQRQAGVSLEEAVKAGLKGGTHSISIVFSAGHDKKSSLDPSFIDSMIGSFKRLVGSTAESLSVYAKEDVSSKMEELDFFDSFLKGDVSVKVGNDRRLPLHDRWDAIINLAESWKKQNLIK